MGDAMHRSQHASPVVGILPWGVVNTREEMTVLSGEQQALPYKSTQCTSEGAERGPQSDFPLCSLCHLAFTLCLYYQA